MGRVSIAVDLRGKTLREIAEEGVSIHIDCDGCWRVTVWPALRVRTAKHFRPMLDKQLNTLADKLRCAECGSSSFGLRKFFPPRPERERD